MRDSVAIGEAVLFSDGCFTDPDLNGSGGSRILLMGIAVEGNCDVAYVLESRIDAILAPNRISRVYFTGFAFQ